MSDAYAGGFLRSPSGALIVGGKNGAPAGFDGGITAGGAPSTGTHVAGEVAIDPVNACFHVCTIAGTPGTWARIGSPGVSLGNAQNTTLAATNVGVGGLLICTKTVPVGTRPIKVEGSIPGITITTGTGRVRVALYDETAGALAEMLQLKETTTAVAGTVMGGRDVWTTRSDRAPGNRTFSLFAQTVGGTTAAALTSGATFPAEILITEL